MTRRRAISCRAAGLQARGPARRLIGSDGEVGRRDALVGRQPAVEEAADPAVDWRIVEGVHAEMDAALLDAGLLQALRIQRPDLLHLQGHLGMELEAEGVGAATEALHRIGVVGGQKLAAVGDMHAFAMPLVDLHRPLEPDTARFGRLDVDIANLDRAAGMGTDTPAEGACQELGAKAEAEIGHACFDHLGNPVELALDAGERAAVVGRHRPAEDHHAGIVRHVFGQVAAEIGAEAIELVTALLEEGADPTGPRVLLVHDDRYFLGNHFFGLFSRYRHGIARYAPLMATTRRTGGGGTKWRAS